jgi:flagella basal body P-ring formation protein FlgA
MRSFLRITLLVFFSCGSVFAAEPESVTVPDSSTSETVQSSPKLQSHSITVQDVATSIAVALKASGAGDELDVRLVGPNRDAVYTYDTPITMQVSDLAFEEKSGTWSATLLFESEGQALTPSKVSGRYDEAKLIPVLKRRLYSDDTIDENDIEMKRMPASRLRKDVVSQKEDLIGKTPLKTISEGRPVRTHEIASSAVVRKGDQVHMKFISGNLEINTLGEALDSGASGSVIRVKNLTSNKVVHAEVKEKDVVLVKTLETIQANKEL